MCTAGTCGNNRQDLYADIDSNSFVRWQISKVRSVRNILNLLISFCPIISPIIHCASGMSCVCVRSVEYVTSVAWRHHAGRRLGRSSAQLVDQAGSSTLYTTKLDAGSGSCETKKMRQKNVRIDTHSTGPLYCAWPKWPCGDTDPRRMALTRPSVCVAVDQWRLCISAGIARSLSTRRSSQRRAVPRQRSQLFSFSLSTCNSLIFSAHISAINRTKDELAMN